MNGQDADLLLICIGKVLHCSLSDAKKSPEGGLPDRLQVPTLPVLACRQAEDGREQAQKAGFCSKLRQQKKRLEA
jgi:hypothetical protein